ncbi:hypothetical protein [Pedococcus bigeumensis]|uniref:Uncharacterized protein n=1 Tax=Pedococcus bigeumensis TaxID=433644 RepID=A0A502CX01_9MICO|nr:hypothetical protein [Pedococcus bigeumensis]TPG17172.1 hypothetical protein EAH86_10440 [Pedococcus bigeumensis]
MGVTRLTADDASVLAVETLGLDSGSIELISIEGIAASLRRAASFMCPTSPSRLVDAVLGALRPLAATEVERTDVADVLELLVASGDLLELRQESGRSIRLLYLAPPSYIERRPGSFLLMGIRPFGISILEGELRKAIEYEGHTRVLELDPDTGAEQLRQLELRPVRKDRWVSTPALEAPPGLIERYRARLDVSGDAGRLDGLVILDAESSVRYYRGRWRAPTSRDNGDMVARRPQAYGADLWCLIRFESGVPGRLMEFPADDPVLPGRDEAWRYQAAVDALRGAPQRFRVRRGSTPEDDTTFDFFGPLPGFAARYLQIAGLALGKTQGALFSFRVPLAATQDVSAFLTDMLWMDQEEAARGV